MNLKALFQKSSRQLSDSQSPQERPTIRLGPAQLLDKWHTQHESGSHVDTSGSLVNSPSPDHIPADEPSASSNQECNSNTPSFAQPEAHRVSVNEENTTTPAKKAASIDDVDEERDNSIETDYRSYMAMSTSSHAGSSVGTEFMSLGGDSRLRTGSSEKKHSEDIADRNIDRYGLTSQRLSSIASQKRGSMSDEHDEDADESPNAHESQPLDSTSFSHHSSYTLGSGIPTEGSLIDGILPHIKDASPRPFDRNAWPPRLAREELKPRARNNDRRGSDGANTPNTKRHTPERNLDPAMHRRGNSSIGLHEAIMSGPEDYPKGLHPNVDGVVDLKDSEDVDQVTRWAPAVTHEVVKPTEHTITQERIYRETHNYEVYHYVQPIYQTEILPARHFVHDSSGRLVEVPSSSLPECTGANQRWAVVQEERKKPAEYVVRNPFQHMEPKIIDFTSHTTPEGFERTETTWLHPAELEDMSNYNGPIIPVEFFHHPTEHVPTRESKKADPNLDRLSNGDKFTMKELSETLPMTVH